MKFLDHLLGNDDLELTPEWRVILDNGFAQWSQFDDDERERLEALVVWFLHRKRWQPAQGFRLTDAQRLIIAAMACVLILELEPDHYRLVKWIVVHRSAVHVNQPSWTGVPGVVSSWGTPLFRR